MYYNTINRGCEKFEYALSLASIVPGANFVSAAIRAKYGCIQITLGLANAALSYTASRFVSDVDKERQLIGEGQQSLHYVVHGVLNIVRAKGEAIPFVGIILLTSDLLVGKIYDYSARWIRGCEYNYCFAV